MIVGSSAVPGAGGSLRGQRFDDRNENVQRNRKASGQDARTFQSGLGCLPEARICEVHGEDRQQARSGGRGTHPITAARPRMVQRTIVLRGADELPTVSNAAAQFCWTAASWTFPP
jgi:hypothetical protein